MIVSNSLISLFLSGLFRLIEGKKYFDFIPLCVCVLKRPPVLSIDLQVFTGQGFNDLNEKV